MEHWHASVAKNSSHVLARKYFQSLAVVPRALEAVCLVNLDADNVISPIFLPALANHWTRSSEAETGYLQPECRPFICTWQSENPGVTGRLAYDLVSFFELGGYDQDLLPMGFQDIDIRDRFLARQRQLRGAGKLQKFTDGQEFAIANDAGNAWADRNLAKIRNVAPRHLGMSWGQMNTKNMVSAKQKTKDGQLVRNVQLATDPDKLGAPLISLAAALAQELGGSAPSSGSGGIAPVSGQPSRATPMIPVDVDESDVDMMEEEQQPMPQQYGGSSSSTYRTPASAEAELTTARASASASSSGNTQVEPRGIRWSSTKAEMHTFCSESSELLVEVATGTFGVELLANDLKDHHTRSHEVAATVFQQAKGKGRGRSLGPAIDGKALLDLILFASHVEHSWGHNAKFKELSAAVPREDTGRPPTAAELAQSNVRVVLQDCRGFADPAAAPDATGRRDGRHIGTSTTNLQAITSNPMWTPLMEEVQGKLEKAIKELQQRQPKEQDGDSTPRVYLLFWCKKGRHRSVSAEFMARHQHKQQTINHKNIQPQSLI